MIIATVFIVVIAGLVIGINKEWFSPYVKIPTEYFDNTPVSKKQIKILKKELKKEINY